MNKEDVVVYIYNGLLVVVVGLHRWPVIKNQPVMQELWFDPWVRKIPWRRAWQLTPVFLPGEPHGQRNLAGYSP